MGDAFDEGRFAAALRTRAIGRALRRLERCGSTNDEAAAWARAGAPHGALVVAEAQSAGRGRLRRAWHSPPGENLYFSTVLRPAIAPQLAPPLTLLAAVALAEAVAAHGATPALKWPNDLLLDGKKAAGILTEMATAAGAIQHVIVGIGVNINARTFPPELPAATSLALALGRTVDRTRFAAALCDHLERWYERFLVEGAAPVVAAWRARSPLLGRPVEVDSAGERLRGIAEDIDPDGALRLRLADGRTHRVLAGEILR
jgi:BirA family biotin operon repressor/biotin-[acetyl-CoA-carboxylase] ligase